MRPASLTLRSDQKVAAPPAALRIGQRGLEVQQPRPPVACRLPTPSCWPVQLKRHSHYNSLQSPANHPARPFTPSSCEHAGPRPPVHSSRAHPPLGPRMFVITRHVQCALATARLQHLCTAHDTCRLPPPTPALLPSCGYSTGALPASGSHPSPATTSVSTRQLPKYTAPGARSATVALHMPRCRGGGARATVLLRETMAASAAG
jgi:hypothetical protein